MIDYCSPIYNTDSSLLGILFCFSVRVTTTALWLGFFSFSGLYFSDNSHCFRETFPPLFVFCIYNKKYLGPSLLKQLNSLMFQIFFIVQKEYFGIKPVFQNIFAFSCIRNFHIFNIALEPFKSLNF